MQTNDCCIFRSGSAVQMPPICLRGTMPSQTPTPELTTRDVLVQIDRRLTLIEEDLRSQDRNWQARLGGMEERWDARFLDMAKTWETGRRDMEEKWEARCRDMEERWDVRHRKTEERWDIRCRDMEKSWEARFSELHRDLNTRFQWAIGITLASWISIMGTVLLK